jgi:hypothetical protein
MLVFVCYLCSTDIGMVLAIYNYRLAQPNLNRSVLAHRCKVHTKELDVRKRDHDTSLDRL